MRVLIIHNTASGFGSDAIFQFERHLLREGDECVMRILKKDTPDLGKRLLKDVEKFDLVVISGGDGTVATLLTHLKYRKVRTCIFPSGTANLFFGKIGNSADPSAIARSCRVGHTIDCDLGEIMWIDNSGRKHRQGFAIMAGIGFDAQIMKAAIPAKRAMGQAAYFAAALANPRPGIKNFTINVDGEVYERAGIGCIVANNAMIQGDIQVVPDCTMTDGLLDVFVCECEATPQLLSPILHGLVDREGNSLGRPFLESFRGHDIEVRVDEPTEIEVDGDPMDGTVMAYRARCLPNANRIIVDPLSRYNPDDHEPKPVFGDTEEIAFPA